MNTQVKKSWSVGEYTITHEGRSDYRINGGNRCKTLESAIKIAGVFIERKAAAQALMAATPERPELEPEHLAWMENEQAIQNALDKIRNGQPSAYSLATGYGDNKTADKLAAIGQYLDRVEAQLTEARNTLAALTEAMQADVHTAYLKRFGELSDWHDARRTLGVSDDR
jgi:hypothetical protein